MENSYTSMVNMLSNSIVLTMCFVCGVFISRDLLSKGVLGVGRIFPMYWFVEGNELINQSEANPVLTADFGRCIGFQLVIAFILFTIGLIISKIKSTGRKG